MHFSFCLGLFYGRCRNCCFLHLLLTRYSALLAATAKHGRIQVLIMKAKSSNVSSRAAGTSFCATSYAWQISIRTTQKKKRLQTSKEPMQKLQSPNKHACSILLPQPSCLVCISLRTGCLRLLLTHVFLRVDRAGSDDLGHTTLRHGDVTSAAHLLLTRPSREGHGQLHPKESLFVALPGGPFEGTNQKARLAPSPSTSPSPNTTESCMINRVESNSHT